MKEQKRSGQILDDEAAGKWWWGVRILARSNTCEKEVWQDKSDDNDCYATIGSDSRRLSLQPACLIRG